MDIRLQDIELPQVQAFLAVAEHGSLSAAARVLGTSQPTVGRQIKAFEAAMGVEMFRRHTRGYALTEAAERLLPAARQMRHAMNALALAAEAETDMVDGTVKIAASVHVAHYVLPRIIAEMRQQAPGIEIVLNASDDSDNLLFRESDIAVRMYRPRQLDLVTRFIGRAPIGAFATPEYLDRRGWPLALGDLKQHDIVGYDKSPVMLMHMEQLGFAPGDVRFPVRCDSQSAYWELVRAGCGIGFAQLPTGRSDPEVEVLHVPIKVPPLEIWLTAHEDVRRIARVGHVWEMLTQALTEEFGRY